jgi:hypothetical protein
MSCYLLSDEQFDALYTALYEREPNGEEGYFMQKWYVVQGGVQRLSAKETVQLWEALNHRALETRYKESGGVVADERLITPRGPRLKGVHSNMPDITLFGILDCLRYQCMDIENSESDPVFIYLDKMTNYVGQKVARKVAGYKWGGIG